MTDPRISKLAHLLVDYSTDVQHDNQVLIWAPGSTTSMPLLLAIYERVLERGGILILLHTYVEMKRYFSSMQKTINLIMCRHFTN